MASQDHIRNPIEWAFCQVRLAALTVGSLGRSLRASEESRHVPVALAGLTFAPRPRAASLCSGTPLGTCTARWCRKLKAKNVVAFRRRI
jgi:hypothetical protein